MGATIDDCKVAEFDISTGENKAVADKIKSLLNNGYEVNMLYGNKTILLIGTKEASAASGGSEESAGSGTTTETTETGGSDNTTPSEGESSGGGE